MLAPTAARTSAVLTFCFETAQRYMFSVRMWKKVVVPKVTTGVRTSGLEMTWMRKISATDRLHVWGAAAPGESRLVGAAFACRGVHSLRT